MPVNPNLIAVTLIVIMGQAVEMAADPEGLSRLDNLPDNGQQLPSDDMLEYLGQWETEKGRRVDPGDLEWLLQPGDSQNDDE